MNYCSFKFICSYGGKPAQVRPHAFLLLADSLDVAQYLSARASTLAAFKSCHKNHVRMRAANFVLFGRSVSAKLQSCPRMADRGDRRSSHGEFKSMNSSSDDPPNSRLFIISSKQLTEDDFRSAFSLYGNIEEIWVVKDRQTGERKGVTYIKYTKTSQAARALEAMNGQVIGNANRPIKVMIAASRDQGSRRDINEEEKIQRLFVIVPKNMQEKELYEHFSQFGDVEYANIIKDKDSRESKGFAYIKFHRFLHAAYAFENCDRKFKAVFAEPRNSRPIMKSDTFEKFINTSFDTCSRNLPLPDVQNTEGYTALSVIAHPNLNQDMLWKLFDLVPSLDYCQVRYEGRPVPMRSVATVVYSNTIWAAYACEKFHGFEYPPGSRLIVKPDPSVRSNRNYEQNRVQRSKSQDIIQLAETIAQASTLLQVSGLSPELLTSKLGLGDKESGRIPLCNVSLPEKQPMAPLNSETVARCFIVCVPHPPPLSALEDVFSRFGNLIEVYMLAHKNCGYAKYTSQESAENAIKTLHGAEVSGIRIKVLKAEERDNYRKRQRMDDDA